MTEYRDLLPTIPGIYSVLVVDDVNIVRRIAFRFLTEAGLRVFEASSGVEALEVLTMAHGRIDLVVVDVVMPEVNGVDLVRLVRERWPDMNVLFMSAHAAEVLVREGLDDPSVMFLAKPFTRVELLEKVLQAITSKGPKRNGEQGAKRERERES